MTTTASSSATPSSAAPALVLLGRVRLLAPGGGEVALPNRKTRAILAVLALTPGGTMRRARIMELLWGDRDEQQARASLRQALHELRAALRRDGGGDDILRTDRDTLGLDLAAFAVDVLPEHAAADPTSPTALLGELEAWRVDLMADLDGLSTAFDAWLQSQRAARRDDLVARAMAVTRAVPPGDTRRELARLVTQLDPTCEEAHRLVLEQLRRERSPGAAAAHYVGLERYFRDEFGVQPDHATRDLAFGLAEAPARAPSAAADWVPGVAPQPAPRRRPQLRVEAPAVDATDPQAATRAALIADDLAYLLAQSGEIDIVTDECEVVVDLTLGGRLVVLERHARLYLWLTSPARPVRLWSERFDLAPEDDGSAADECTARIAAVVLQGVVRQLARLDAISGDSQLEAYRCFVEARELVDVTPNRERLRRALALLEQAVTADPHNAIATIYLVRLLNTQLLETEAGADPGPGRRRALELATASYQLAPQSAAANFVIGWCHLRLRHFDVARWHIEAALGLNPYHPERQTDAATAFMYLGDADRAIDCVEQATRLDPRHLDQRWADALEIHVMRRDPKAALAAAERMRTLDIRRSAWVAVAAAHAGEAERARHARDVALAHGERLWVGREPFSAAALRRWLFEHLPFARSEDADYVGAGLDSAGWSG